MPAPPHIIDVHPADNPFAVTPSDILSGLSHPINQKYLPTILLYDEKGLRLYDDITTFAKEYYLFAAEEEILKNKADEIVRVMHGGHDEAVDGEVVLELGAGALRKTSHILLALSRLRPAASPITYFALDLEQRELERTISQINMSDNIGKHLSGKVDTKGIWGTYDDGLKFVREGGLIASPSSDELVKRVEESLASNNTTRDASPAPKSVTSGSTESSSPGPLTPNSESASNLGDKPMHLLFLGSSLGNFSREAGTSFLESLPLRPGSGDTLLIGLDHDNSKEAVESAYNDSAGYTKKFIMNGLTAAGRILGDEHLFDEKNWEYVNKYDADLRRHEAFVKSKRVQVIKVPSTGEEHKVAEGEIVKIEESFKYSDADAYQLFTLAGLRPIQRWSNNANQYSLWLLERPLFHFSLLSQPTTTNTESSPFGVPTRADWNRLWACWDFITLQMIPLEMLHRRPIDLRHICLFYIGHIPTFLDIHLSRLLGEKNTEPEVFKYIFERGIDPNVDDPTVCHDHSEVPEKEEDWPSLPALLDFRDRVRERLMNLYDRFECSDPSFLTRKVARVLFMTHEHEALHAETLLYMLVQSSPGSAGGTISPPGFARPPFEQLAKEQWNVKVSQPSETTVTLGPTKIDIGHDDSEKDDLEKSVAGHEFGWDNEHPKREVEVPEFRIEWKPVTNGEFYEFWTKQGKEKSIRLPASWVEAEDGTVSVRTLYGPIPLDIANNWPVMADYEAMSAYAVVKGGRLPTDCELRLFMDKFHHGYSGGDANVGFRNWHPVPATTSAAGKKGHNGGVWEWTSTVFSEHQGFEASKLYPGYSKDFFDGCHQVVLGGSFATIPRLSERRSVKNWYQKNYPYAFIGGRVAYDV